MPGPARRRRRLDASAREMAASLEELVASLPSSRASSVGDLAENGFREEDGSGSSLDYAGWGALLRGREGGGGRGEAGVLTRAPPTPPRSPTISLLLSVGGVCVCV
jgi:hypothetical protein